MSIRILLSFFIYMCYVLSAVGSDSLTKYINPFIGTANGGNTFPGAVVPWGMISLSPHNSPGSPSGYIAGEKYFYGIGSTHLSGTGCADLGGIIVSFASTLSTKPEEYKAVYSEEYAEPGYYSARLPDLNVKLETTVSNRSGFIRISADEDTELFLLIDAGRSLAITGGGSVSVKSPRHIEGYNISGGFCGESNRQTVYFSSELSQSPIERGVWHDDEILESYFTEAVDTSAGAWVRIKIHKSKPALIKIGISYTRVKNAQMNMHKEIPDWDFAKVRREARMKWEEQLRRIIVSGGSETDKVMFYTSVYHMLIHPNIISDTNGEYPMMGRHQLGKYTGKERYSVFSLWDTYRTLHPFLMLVYPEVQSAIIQTMLDMYRESGFLPKWELAGNETYMMVGDASSIVIADSYIKGIRDFNENEAMKAMLKPVLFDEGQNAPPIRAGYNQLLKYGYIPFEQDTSDEWWVWGPVSTSLEYNLNDWCIAVMADTLGRQDIADKFYEKSIYYANIFDTTTLFMRPRLKNGSWLTPFDSTATEGSGYWAGSGGPGYVEGNAWNYTWFVPHDIEGLIKLFGGEGKFFSKLERCFEENHFTINNEPDIAYPFLFTYIDGKESISTDLVEKIIDEDFGTGSNGLPGNDDCGTISGWLAFSMLGLYPDCPAKSVYRLVTPRFAEVTIKLNTDYYSGKELLIRKVENKSGEISFNGFVLDGYEISHEKLVGGGVLQFD
ncbi:MAG: GH92 family glycosyl hydrolase [Melioribacteraceae bacterium]|nr:GH92 family glycosyl hydrolase [Melioribacteraceae bacterium]